MQKGKYTRETLLRNWNAIRDADMLANLKMMKEDNNIYAIRDSSNKKLFEPVINLEMVNSVLEKKGFDIKNVMTTFDSWAVRLCYINMFYFPYSQEMCKKYQILPFLFDHIDCLKKQSEQYGYYDFSVLNQQLEQIKKAY